MDFDINYEYVINKNNEKIFTCFYVPKGNKDKYPLVIISHGFMANYQALANFAVFLAEKESMASPIASSVFSSGSTYSASPGLAA